MDVFLKNKYYRRFSIASFLSTAGDILFYLAFLTYASKIEKLFFSFIVNCYLRINTKIIRYIWWIFS